jgi:hypothetical protein
MTNFRRCRKLSSPRKKFLCALITLLLLVFAVSSVYGQEKKALKVTTHELAYANLYRNVDIPEDASVIAIDYSIRGVELYGYGWGPAAFLYWDALNYVGIRLDSTSAGRVRTDLSGGRKNTEWGALGKNAWIDMKVVITPTEVFFYAKNSEVDEWILFNTDGQPVPRPDGIAGPPKGIVIGSGRANLKLPDEKPYLRNSNPDGDLRKVGHFYIDNITIRADDKVVFYEDFEKTLDTLRLEYDMASDPANEEPVFEIVDLREDFPEGKEVWIYPNPSWDGDIKIGYLLPDSAQKITLSIYNEAGRKVFEGREETPLKGYNEFLWDGRDNEGVSVSTGVYSCILTVECGEGPIIYKGLIVKA